MSNWCREKNCYCNNTTDFGYCKTTVCIKSEKAPTVKTIPIELYEQVRGERDVAIEQLKSLNIELFEKPYLKAITIEWLKKYASKKSYDDEMDCYWTFWEEDVLKMIEDWEKENGTEESNRNI